MIGGPLLVRELLTTPRHLKQFGIRAGYVAMLCILIYTGAQTTFGLTPLRGLGDIANFGIFIFNILCVLQLGLVIATSLLFSAGNVAQEKDRRTLILLLMTDLSSPELVLGKSLGSTLPVLVLIGVSLPVLCFVRMLGGISLSQVIWVELLCLVAALAASAWGTLVAYWREKTFQIIAVSLLGAGLFIGLAETICSIAGTDSAVGRIAGYCNPFRTLSSILHPLSALPNATVPEVGAWGSVLALAVIAVGLWTWTCIRVRVWNPSRFLYTKPEETAAEAAAEAENNPAPAVRQTQREIWSTPILWREICTQAYGRKVGIIKFAYFLFAFFCILWLSRMPVDSPLIFGALSGEGLVFVMLSLVSLVLVNAQAVTSLTSERDGQTLELLLVTEVTAKEFVFGKLGGIFFNTKEVIIIPLLFATLSLFRGSMSLEPFLFAVIGYLVLVCFSAMMGLHAAFSYENSRAAIANSLGTIFFLFVGIFICMMLIVEARTSFILQLVPFLLFILGGSVGLWTSLTHKNPSPALTICAWSLPFLTFYGIVSFLLGDTAAVCAAVVVAYGFTSIAMLVPAVSAFDVALGRTTVDRG
ncbi:ABC transporter permease [Planctomicrobium sp. SH664]|uniref:ABC transporter permease n=1 Tax=Planctomicrobium sp. SH664 TaxID=3448125 RepID=UPI003F5BDA87